MKMKNVILNIQYLLTKNDKSKYWLVKKLETDYRYVTKLMDNKTKSISFEMIGKLCSLLECTPNELFIFIEAEEELKED